jgi:uncharacterized membrane protein YfcA
VRLALELFAAAFVASVFGSMVGLGGGFILVPILRLFLGFSPAYAAGTSLVLIVANSASGAFTYLLQRRVHLKIGLLIAAGGLPGSLLGAIASFHISAKLFDALLAVLLIAVAVDMAWNDGWPGASSRIALRRSRACRIERLSRWASSSASSAASSAWAAESYWFRASSIFPSCRRMQSAPPLTSRFYLPHRLG